MWVPHHQQERGSVITPALGFLAGEYMKNAHSHSGMCAFFGLEPYQRGIDFLLTFPLPDSNFFDE